MAAMLSKTRAVIGDRLRLGDSGDLGAMGGVGVTGAI
jgi:hypothetical protein